ncbi:MAG: sulfatase-like hydrolase/transferase [Akkermansiaceae bacterium]|nr:sulfatase-like hydrolase/transferase [Akkermansiaceae bacterium]NNM28742.1 sulfatase-like hydrolase/transferase [Akkermansiaceae bacterium]
MPRPLLLLCLLFLPWGSVFAGQPNIVYIISDDHDYEHLGFMGNKFVHTPTLDGLAKQGTVFPKAHLPMARCHPTLASFLSGRWPHQTGIYYNYGEKPLSPENSLPNQLKDAGYATYVEGKYWEGDPRAMGFTHGAGKTAKTFVRDGQDELFGFIDEVGGKKPMFIWWAPLIPHTPHNPPKKFKDLYDWAKMPVPAYMEGRDLGPGKKKGGWRKKEELSYAMEAWLDDGVTKLVEKLRKAGQLENTMFVFVIDNGWCNGRPSKGSPFEKGVRTPVFFTLPGTVKAGQRFDRLISTNDIYPTILDYAGAAIPASAAGQSLRPVMEGKEAARRKALFGAIYPAFATKGDNRPERDIYALYMRDERWKYILYLQDVRADRNQKYFRIQAIECDYPERARGDEDLFDLEADPYEQKNLARDPKHRERMDAMKAEALMWWKETGGKNLPQ